MAADDAVGAPSRAPRNPISRRRIEVVIARSVATFGLIFAAQAAPTIIEQSRGMVPTWNAIIFITVLGGLLVSVIAALTNRFVHTVNGFMAISWFAAMASWSIAVLDTGIVGDGQPWLYYLLTVATAAGAVAWPPWAATAALFVSSITYGLVRVTPAGGSAPIDIAALNTIYAVLLGGAVVIIITMLRQAAAAVDFAQTTAIDRYSHAVREHATEVERVQVDAIVHDSVLTTFLSAARAETPAAKKLAGTMAENAMGYLRDAATSVPDGAGVAEMSALAASIKAAVADVPATFVVRRTDAPAGSLPSGSAEAVYSAAVQAMMNSAQHAGSAPTVRRWLAVRELAGGGIEVEVGDNGVGFDMTDLPTGRLGLRVSMMERMANAGGVVEVDSAPGKGTVIRIKWPAPGALRSNGQPRLLIPQRGRESR